ncbi:2'-5' RNA ligase family protein [Kocuria sabuli]|uniref:2'-5' RNA ligase family protein n=1 Tax=Kocuria sabuli TaxID=3071448 RepID=UPI0034D4764E
MHSLELLLGEDAEASVRADWDRLIEAGLPSSGRHRSPSNRPHITVMAAPSLAPETVPGIDERVAAAAGFVDLPLASAGVLLFGPGRGGYVVVRQVVTTPELLELHRRVWDAVGPVPGQPRTSFPGAWTPHVTLARRMHPDQVAAALDVLEPHPAPLRAVSLRRWDSDARTVVRLA